MMIKKDKKKIVFILGYGRSGTTLLMKMLNAHPEIYFFKSEFNRLPFFMKYDKYYEKYKDKKYYFLEKDIRKHPTLDIKKRKIYAKDFKDFVNKFFDSFRKEKRKNIVGIKSANFIEEQVEFIKKMIPDAYCIHIVRDIRDIFLSQRKAKIGAYSPFYIAKSWKENINIIRSLKKDIKNFYEIRYEDLIRYPQKEIQDICDFLGIRYSSRMLNYYRYNKAEIQEFHNNLSRPIIKDNYNKWIGKLSKKKLDMIYAASHKRLFELGYTKKDIIKNMMIIKRVREYIIDKIMIKMNEINSMIKIKKKIYYFKIKLKRKYLPF